MIKMTPTILADLIDLETEVEIPTLFQDMEWCIEADHIDAMTLFNKDLKVICIAGLVHLRPGVAEAFIIRTKLIQTHKLEFYRIIKNLLDRCFDPKGYGLHRIQLSIDCSWIEGAKWATSIGFKFEGIAKSYVLNKDHAIYARVKWQPGQ